MTLSPVAKCLAVELSLSVLTTQVCHSRDLNTQPSTCKANTLRPKKINNSFSGQKFQNSKQQRDSFVFFLFEANILFLPCLSTK